MLSDQPDHVLVALGQSFLLLRAGVRRRALGGRQPVIRGGQQPVGVHRSRGGGRGLSVPAGQLRLRLRLLSSGPVGLHLIKRVYSGGSARQRAVIETDGRALVGGWERRRREARDPGSRRPALSCSLRRRASAFLPRGRRSSAGFRVGGGGSGGQSFLAGDVRLETPHGLDISAITDTEAAAVLSLARSLFLLLFVREQLQVHYGRRSVRDDVIGSAATTLNSLES